MSTNGSKKILITGGSHSEAPLIRSAQEMGYFVISTGNDEGAQGHLLANKYVKGDFSDKDFVLNLARDEKVDAIISGANDFAYISTAYACEKLHLKGHDTYENSKIIHNKDKFRILLNEIGVRAPKIFKCKSRDDVLEGIAKIGFPLLVKPIDLTGGKGVKKCIEVNETLDAFTLAMSITREDHVILEEYIEGANHGFTSLIKNQKVVWYMIDDEQYGINKYLVRGACSPSSVEQHSEYTLIKDVEKVAKSLNLVDGLFHVQFIVDKTGYPIMIDPCRRTPGDLYILLAKYVTGVDYPYEIVNAEMGMEVQDYYINERNFVARECIMTSKKGVIKKVHISDEIKPYIVYSLLGENKGIRIEQPLKHKAGILIMKFPSYNEMSDILDRFEELAWIELVNEND